MKASKCATVTLYFPHYVYCILIDDVFGLIVSVSLLSFQGPLLLDVHELLVI